MSELSNTGTKMSWVLPVALSRAETPDWEMPGSKYLVLCDPKLSPMRKP